MSKIHFVRHQVAGVLYEYPFEVAPSDAQVGQIAVRMARLHGTEHPKTKEPYWVQVVSYDMIGPDDEIQVGPPPGQDQRAAPPVTVAGSGTVENP